MQYRVSNTRSEIDFECGRNGDKRILQNVHNLLMTMMGEVPFDRMRGVYGGIYDMSAPDADGVILPLLDAVMTYEPRVSVIETDTQNDDEGNLIITLTVEIKEDE